MTNFGKIALIIILIFFYPALAESNPNDFEYIDALGTKDRVMSILKVENNTDIGIHFDLMIKKQKAIWLSYIGCFGDSHSLFMNQKIENMANEKFNSIDKVNSEQALSYISGISNNSRIIIVNEAHHVPLHRAFSILLLRELKSNGYTHFAAEALGGINSGFYKKGYPERTPFGGLTDDPLYGDMIRIAIEMGYILVPYEHTPNCANIGSAGCQNERERGQAGNIVSRSGIMNGNVKILVHVGYGHALEKSHRDGVKFMAQHLSEITNIDPITIDQTTVSDEIVSKFHEKIELSNNEKDFYILFKNDGQPLNVMDGYDFTIINNDSEMNKNRPNWLRMGGFREDLTLPSYLCGPVRPCLVQAFFYDEPNKNSVPADQIIIVSKKIDKPLILRCGRYKIYSYSINMTPINYFEANHQTSGCSG